MKIAIPVLIEPSASIVVRTASHGPFALRLIDCPDGISKRVVAFGATRANDQVVLNDIPVQQVARRLFDGFEVDPAVQPELAGEIVAALIAADQARIVTA